MNDQSYLFPKFYITSPSPCPYLKGKYERKVFTDLSAPDPAAQHENFNRMGFRRSQNIVYRPACEGCSRCVSVRVVVDDFAPTKSMRRTLKKFETLEVADEDAAATFEQFELLKAYLSSRHANGGMAGMDEFEYAEMVETSPITTRLVEYRLARPEKSKNRRGALTAVALTDVMSDGLSLVYSFFNPDKDFSGLGTFVILDHVMRAKAAGLPFVYLGYWIKGSRTMAYKARFKPLESLTHNGWRPFTG